MTVLTIASAAASAYAQKQGADAQTASNERQYQNTVVAANANYAQTGLAQVQQHDAAQQKLEQNNLEARKAVGTAKVSAGENGVTGCPWTP